MPLGNFLRVHGRSEGVSATHIQERHINQFADALDGFPTSEEINGALAGATMAAARVVDVTQFGAIGGGLGTSIAAAGGNLSSIRSASGQSWLEATDSMDLAAFLLAQAVAESTGRSVFFPRDDYVFTAPGFLHAGVKVDLGGSTVTNTNTDATRFPRSNRVFLLGILARQDFDRFDTAGWTQQADTAAQDAVTLTNVTGTMPAIGAILMIRTLAATGSPDTLPSYTTWNEVASVSGTTITLKYPLELAITSVRFVNYNVITTRKDAMPGLGVGSAEPHVYYCAANASLTNGTLVATDGPAFEFNAALNTDIDVRIDARKGQAVYGNSLNRCRVRVAGTCGGPKGPIELAVGSALSIIDADLRYSGDDQASAMGLGSGSYPHIQLGEFTESCIVKGRLDMGGKPGNQGVTTPTGNRNTVDVEMTGRGLTANVVVFASNSGVGNRVSGRFEASTNADYFCLWSAGTGSNNWLENASFIGAPSANGLRFQKASAGGARNVTIPSGGGQLVYDTSCGDNPVSNSYIADGISSAGPPDRLTIPYLFTTSGTYPRVDRILSVSASTTVSGRDCWGERWIASSSGAVRTMSLPVSKIGMTIWFQRTGANAVRIDPNGTEVIGAGGAGKYLELQSDGGSIQASCHTAGTWVVGNPVGTITYEP